MIPKNNNGSKGTCDVNKTFKEKEVNDEESIIENNIDSYISDLHDKANTKAAKEGYSMKLGDKYVEESDYSNAKRNKPVQDFIRKNLKALNDQYNELENKFLEENPDKVISLANRMKGFHSRFSQ
jgi:hypothetical protein